MVKSRERMTDFSLLQALSQEYGISGYEDRIRSIVIRHLSRLVDSVSVDRLGNVVGRRRGSGPMLMLAAHMDEIGFITSHIDEKDGLVRIHPVAGIKPAGILSQLVKIHTTEGSILGRLSSTTERKESAESPAKGVAVSEMFVDTGLPPKQVKGSVQVGDPVTFIGELIEQGDCLLGKALDNRAGLFIGLEALRLANSGSYDLVFVATSREEVGARGAFAIAQELRPAIGIALDATPARDTPGVPVHLSGTRLGAGAAIKVVDAGGISDQKLVDILKTLASDESIPYQMEVLSGGGTDAAALQFAGAAVTTLSLPVRYLHSCVEMARKSDVQACTDLLTAFLTKSHPLVNQLATSRMEIAEPT